MFKRIFKYYERSKLQLACFFEVALDEKLLFLDSATADFLDLRIGNPEMSEAETQAEWSKLMEELQKVLGLSASTWL